MDKRSRYHSNHLFNLSKIKKRNKVKPPSKWKRGLSTWKKSSAPVGRYNAHFEIKDISSRQLSPTSEGTCESYDKQIQPKLFKQNVQSSKTLRTNNLELPSTSSLTPYIASNKRKLMKTRVQTESSSSAEDSEDNNSELEEFYKNSSRDQREIQDAVKAQLIKEGGETRIGVFSDIFSIGSEKESSSSSSSSDEMEEESPISRNIGVPQLRADQNFASRNESQDLSMSINERRNQQAEKNNFFIFHDRDNTIVLLRKNAEVVFSGMALVKVLSGEVEILGYKLTPKMSKYIPLYSKKLQVNLTIKSSLQDSIPLNEKQMRENLIRKFHCEFNAEAISRNLLHNVQQLSDLNSTVIVLKTLLTKGAVNYALHMANYESSQNYMGESVKINNYEYEKLVMPTYSLLSTTDVKHIDMSDVENVLEEILSNIHYSNSHGSMPPRILLCGPKNTGKSTIIRYLINSLISKCSKVMHLEADPGQCEFTPSGCVSLCCVEDPLLGPPFTHLKTPEAMVYVGGKSIINNPDTYCGGIFDIMVHYKKMSPQLPLLINTMGWTINMGKNILVDVIRYSDPTFIIQLNSLKREEENLPNMTSGYVNELEGWKTNIGDLALGYELRVLCVKAQQQSFKDTTDAKLFRNLGTFSYWGRLQPKCSTEHFQALNSFKPFKVPFKKIGLFFCNDSPPQSQVLDAINVGLVALCRVDKMQMERDAQYPHFPKKINSIEGNVHLGYGIVRGINLKEETILLITPEPLKRLQVVNALVMGFEDFPIKLLSSQKVNGAVPFVAKPFTNNKASLGDKLNAKRKNTDIHHQHWFPAIL